MKTGWTVAGAMLPWKDPGADPASWLRDLRTLAACGFAAVDITDSWLKPGRLGPTQLADLGSAIREADLTLAAISAIRCSVIDPIDGEANLAYSHATLDAAAELGCEIVSVGFHRPLTSAQKDVLWFWTVPGAEDERDEETYLLAARRIRELAEHGQTVGVRLSLEMYEDTLLGDAASACRLLDMVGHQNVGLNPDIGNLVRQQHPIDPIVATLEKVLPVTNYWHVKNCIRLEMPEKDTVLTYPAPLRTGVIDYRSAFALAAELDFKGPLCIEHYGGDMLGVMTENLAYCQELLGETA